MSLMKTSPTPANADPNYHLGKPVPVPHARSHLIHLSSDYADFHTGSSANFTSAILEPLNVHIGEELHMSLYSAEIPNVLRNVTSKNNYFTLAITPVIAAANADHRTYDIVLDEGYYTGLDLSVHIAQKLNEIAHLTQVGWAVGYTVERKFRFTATPQAGRTGIASIGFLFMDIQAMIAEVAPAALHIFQELIDGNPVNAIKDLLDGAATLMGFDKLGAVFPLTTGSWGFQGVVGVTSHLPVILSPPRVANLYREHGIYIRSNLGNSNIYSNYAKGWSNIIARVPITSGFGHVIFYQPNEGHFKTLITQQVIDRIVVELTDREGFPLDLQGLAWEIALRFDVIPTKK